MLRVWNVSLVIITLLFALKVQYVSRAIMFTFGGLALLGLVAVRIGGELAFRRPDREVGVEPPAGDAEHQRVPRQPEQQHQADGRYGPAQRLLAADIGEQPQAEEGGRARADERCRQERAAPFQLPVLPKTVFGPSSCWAALKTALPSRTSQPVKARAASRMSCSV